MLNQEINTSVDMSQINGGTSSEVKNFKRDQITKSYQPGRYFTVGITYKL